MTLSVVVKGKNRDGGDVFQHFCIDVNANARLGLITKKLRKRIAAVVEEQGLLPLRQTNTFNVFSVDITMEVEAKRED